MTAGEARDARGRAVEDVLLGLVQDNVRPLRVAPQTLEVAAALDGWDDTSGV